MADLHASDEVLAVNAAVDLGEPIGCGSAAFCTLVMVCAFGPDSMRSRLSRTTWYRHQRILVQAGLISGRQALAGANCSFVRSTYPARMRHV